MLGAALMVISGGLVVGSQVVVGRYTDTIRQEGMLGEAGRSDRGSLDGPLDILLVGVDQRPDSSEPIRADSIIIAHIPAAHDQAYLVSIPRDLAVEIPAYARTGYAGGRDKVNAAFAFGSQNGGGRRGGVELLGLTVNKLTGLTFDAAGIVDFGGFQAVVKALGGVDMCIDTRVTSYHIGTDRQGRFLPPDQGGTPVVYEPGCRRLAPWQALDYVRQRYGLPNGDYDRARHQQQFIKAMVKEARKQGVAKNPVKLYQIMRASGDALTVDTQGVPLEEWVLAMTGVVDGDVVMLKTNGGKANASGPDAAERLTPESVTMFEALRADRLQEFVAAHPEFVSTDGSP